MARAPLISISTSLETANLITSANRAKAVIRDFGAEVEKSGGSVIKTRAAMNLLEGNFQRSNIVVARFLNLIPGIAPLIEAAFPIAGAIALGAIIVQTGAKFLKFRQDMEEAPRKFAEAFRELAVPLREANEELAVTNARLENEIAKLEGKRQNNLTLALLESVAAADKLADSIDKDIQKLQDLLEKKKVGMLDKILGEAGTDDLKKMADVFRTDVAGISARFKPQTDAEQVAYEAAQREHNAAGMKLHAAQIEIIAATEQREISKRYAQELKDLQGLRTTAVLESTPRHIQDTSYAANYSDQFTAATVPGQNETKRLAAIKAYADYVSQLDSSLKKTATHTDDLAKKQALEINKDNSRDTERPFENRIAELDAKLVGIKAQLAAVGQDEAFQIQAKATAEAAIAITQINDALKKRYEATKQGSPALTKDQEQQIKSRELAIATGESQTEWAKKLDETTKKIKDQTISQQMLTAAIGKGYEATKRASIETQLMKDLGPEKYNELLNNNTDALNKLKTAASAYYDAQSAEKSASQVHTLEDQIELEKRLAAVQIDGAAAVRYMTLQVELEQRARQGGIGSEKELAAIREKFAANQANASAKDLATIQERTTAVGRLIAAQLHGAEAVRQAQLQSKYDEMNRKGGASTGISPLASAATGGDTLEVIAEKAKDVAERYSEINAKVHERVDLYKNELEALTAQEAMLLNEIGTGKANANQARALDEIQKDILKAEISQNLALGTIRAGMKAFFEELQRQAKDAGVILYDALNSALDKTSDQLSKLLTGKKTEFGKMLDEIGTSILREAIKSGLQKGLGQLDKIIDPKGAAQKAKDLADKKAQLELQKEAIKRDIQRPLGTSNDPVYVSVVNGPQSSTTTAEPPNGTAGAKAGSILSKIGAAIGMVPKIIGLIGSAGGGSDSKGTADSTIAYGGIVPDNPGTNGGVMGYGGYVSADQAYVVGDKGPEILTGASGRIISNSEARQAFSGGGDVHNHIDARGADLGAAGRIRHGLEATHASAVANSQKVAAEHRKRTPQRAA